MLYTHKELINTYKSDYQIKKALKEKLIYKIEDGIYADTKNVHYLSVFSKKYPNAVISGDSAYYYLNLTDVIPSKITVTLKRTAGRYADNRIIKSYAKDKYYDLGKTVIEVEGTLLNIYDKERMLIELVKNKNNMPYDYYKEIIESYRNNKLELDMIKLQKYLSIYNNGDKYKTMILDEVF